MVCQAYCFEAGRRCHFGCRSHGTSMARPQYSDETREPVHAAHLGLLMCNLACRRVVCVDSAANKAIHERIVIPRSSWSAIE
jgi:hypothetical protein